MAPRLRQRRDRPVKVCRLVSVGLVLVLVCGFEARVNAAATDAVTVAGGHGAGPAADQLNFPLRVAVDGHGDVFVADTDNGRVHEWKPGAGQGRTVAESGPAANQMGLPSAVAVDGHGDLFIADSFNNRVQEVSLPQHTNGSAHSLTALSYYDTTSESQAPQMRAGEQVVVVATVNGGARGAPPGGTVAFSDGPNDLGAVPLSSSLVASYTILFTTLTAGTHAVTARYSGDGTYTPSAAKPFNITVTRQ